ncbi:sugar-binding transcriptional regulator [Rothia kristinae]|uniref:sugar-binding transcriptional regulator n=1 Tax=Rothia kristinae TaxID=37923 RepID=UPI000C268ED8|nr:sugar-binding domain-containing protein [Rothia kristinae]MCT1356487.1 transcriptional regulator [Rothia kristinae]MCT1392180.1 transcriptional regulator [Rothia kristinae]MCT1505053.1 transcriptional regulator [Rothia kristinae]MCT2037589.1 transcriptional regulator [Rothia kristinae]MCT2242582.1 transcriptional regulator [Rothia kristinae]
MPLHQQTADLYDPDRLYAVARLYYEEERSQSEIAADLKVSRPTISRMLAHARETGMVQIRVIHPHSGGGEELREQVRTRLGLSAVYLAEGLQHSPMGRGMQLAVRRAILDMELHKGDGLVISSGKAMWDISHMDLPDLRDVALAPGVGGVAEPEPWHQTNEIVRTIALKTGATYTPIFAGAIPSPLMFQALQEDSAFQEVRRVWATAKGALVGVGSPTTGRTSIASAIPKDSLRDSAGDICLHFFDQDGKDLIFPGSDRTVRIPRELLSAIPHVTAVALGQEKVGSILISSRAGMFTRLVTDEATARQILEAAD